MLLFEDDLIRYFATRAQINKKKANINMQLGYCMQNMNDETVELSKEQLEEIHKQWDKISFAYPVNTQRRQVCKSKNGKCS